MKPAAKLHCSINLFPLTIVVVVLLVQFMIVPQSSHGGVGIDMPRVKRAIQMPGAIRTDAVIVGIMRDGKIFLGNEQIPPDQVEAQFRKRLHAVSIARAIYIKADARANFGRVSQVLDGIRGAGLQRIVFLVEQNRTCPRCRRYGTIRNR